MVLTCFKVTYRHSPVEAKYLITGVLTTIYFRKQARFVITVKGLDQIKYDPMGGACKTHGEMTACF